MREQTNRMARHPFVSVRVLSSCDVLVAALAVHIGAGAPPLGRTLSNLKSRADLVAKYVEFNGGAVRTTSLPPPRAMCTPYLVRAGPQAQGGGL